MITQSTQNGLSSAGQPRVIAGRYELRHVLGNGGMATVFHAWDREQRRECAVKLPADNLVSDEEFRRRFRQEAEAAGGLVHPRIARVYAYGEDGPSPYMVMEHVDGGTLRDLLHRRGRLPEPLALRLAAEVAEALAFAHDRGLVHRDIKPHNILLTGDQHVKVADFGIARTLGESSHTRAGSVLGSTQYLSPEQARGEQAAPASDQYSLGVVLYEMLAGRLPFEEAETPVAMALKHINEPPFDLQWLRAGLSDATVTVVRRLLAKSPRDRYPAASDLAAALRRIYVRFGKEDGAATAVVALPVAGADSARGATVVLKAGGEARRRLAPASRRDSMPAAVLPAILSATAIGSDLASPRRRPSRRPDTGRMGGWSAPRRRSGGARVALAVIGLLGLWMAAGAAYQAAHLAPGSPSASHQLSARALPAGQAQVPSLVGQPLDAAQRAAASSQLSVAVASSRQDPNAAQGVVLDQDPSPDAAVARGATIHVIVSQGSGVVPDLRGVPLDDARKQLAAAGLRLGETTQTADDTVASGMIVSASPAPSTHLAANSQVDLVVSGGPTNADAPSPAQQAPAAGGPAPADAQTAPARPTALSPAPPGVGAAPQAVPASTGASWSSGAVVPNVTGVSIQQALAQLRAARLRIGQVNYTHNMDAASGVVIYQARVAGTQVAPNDPVDLLVSDGPAGRSTQTAP
jgi:eukaryotic-like serine/threonine-protein kinase